MFYVEMAKIIFQLSSNMHFICSPVHVPNSTTCTAEFVNTVDPYVKTHYELFHLDVQCLSSNP